MKTALVLVCLLMTAGFVYAAEEAAGPSMETDELNPWIGKYCVSYFTKTRSAKTVPEGKWLLSLKYEDINYDQMWSKSMRGAHHSLPSGKWRDIDKLTFCAKYGWAKDHQIAIGIPYFDNNFNIGSTRNSSAGVGNVFVFEKWNVLKETNTLPAVSVDVWYYFPSGDPKRMLGTDDDSYKVTTEISKAWKDFSLHLNPGYRWNKQDGDNDECEVNAAILFTPTDTVWPAVEYNYWHKKGSGRSHDIVPGVIWKYRKGGSIKAGVVINMDSTFTYRDRCGLVLKISQYF